MLSGVDSVIVKDHIRRFSGELSKIIVDHALASLFERGIADMEDDPSRISEMMPGEYWSAIKQTVPWASGEDLPGHVVFSLVATLLISHNKYDASKPYDKFKHQYGNLAEAVHTFSGILRQHHLHNIIIMNSYFDSSVTLDSDTEGGEEDGESDYQDYEAGVEAKAVPSGPETGEDVAMTDYQGGEEENEDGQNRVVRKLAGRVEAMELD